MSNRWLLSSIAAFVLASPAAAQDNDFFRGKIVTLAAGAAAGGSLDLQARLVSQHLSRHIPGNPSIIVEYVPGAASRILADRVYNIAPKDGTWIGIIFPGAILDPLYRGSSAVNYDPEQFIYLGSGHSEMPVCIARRDVGIESVDDLKEREFIVGATAPGSANYDTAAVARSVGGANFRFITGYQGNAGIRLALERSEVDVVCGSWSVFSVQYPEILGDDHEFHVLFQAGAEIDTELAEAGVPHLLEMTETDEQRQILEFFSSTFQFGSTFVIPPEVPAEQAEVLRQAFQATFEDPELLQQAEDMGIDVNYTPSDRLRELVENLYEAPEEIVSALGEILTAN